MSGFRWIVLLVGSIVLGILVPAFVLAPVARSLPDLAVRTVRWHTHSGVIFADTPVGQGFQSAANGLHRVDVRMFLLEKPFAGSLELRLREGSIDGPEIRRSYFDPEKHRPFGNWVPFEFAPIPDSWGKSYYFDIRPGSGAASVPCALWIRYRGQLGETRPWGTAAKQNGEVEASFRSPHPGLTSLAVAFDRLEPEAEARLELFAAGDDTTPSRSATVTGLNAQNGHVFFTFNPIQRSYGQDYRVRLSVGPGAVVRTIDGELSFKSYHGRHDSDPALFGMISKGELARDRDLYFRTWAHGEVSERILVLQERSGGAMIPALVLWLTAVVMSFYVSLRER